MGFCPPHKEKLAINTQVTNAGGAYLKISPFKEWMGFSTIVAAIVVEDVNAGATDELVVELVSRLSSTQDWFTLATFVTVLGNSSDPAILQQTIAVNRDGAMGWGSEVAVRATPGSGGGEDFTFSFLVEAE